MRIGIDVDDTITNTYDYLIPKIGEYYNVDSDNLLKRALSYDDFLNNDEFPNFSIYAGENYQKFIYEVPVKKGAVEYINRLKEEGNEIIIITARHAGEYDNPYEITQDYLLKHQIPFDKIIIGALDKGKVSEEENIDIFIDDSINNCLKVKNHGIETLLFDARFNRHNKDLRRVNSWKEVHEIIKNNQK